MAEAVLEVEELAVGYGERLVVRDVDLRVERGEIVALLGQSGCGKSTVIRAVVGLLAPAAGRIRVLGRDLGESADEERVAVLRRVGMLFQAGALLGSMTVGDNVGLPLREHTRLGPALVRRVVETKLAAVGLAGAADLMPAELSGGMRKRASLSRAMVLDPELLLCDEPSAGLDPIVAAGIDETLLAVRRMFGMGMLVVSHDIASVQRIADRALLMKDGVIVARGSPAEMAASRVPTVRDFFDRRPPPAVQGGGPSLLEALAVAAAAREDVR